jgi:hypothetical protein
MDCSCTLGFIRDNGAFIPDKAPAILRRRSCRRKRAPFCGKGTNIICTLADYPADPAQEQGQPSSPCCGKEVGRTIPSRSSTLRISSNLAEMLPSGKRICPRP